jgi:hypothetical protein
VNQFHGHCIGIFIFQEGHFVQKKEEKENTTASLTGGGNRC